MAPARPASRPRGRLGIGEVLSELRADFPSVSVSKLRFLEAEGLVTPERTSAGYRKFSRADVERLRYVLGAQRDQYLPLKVIGEHLDAMDRGLEPPAAAGEAARAPRRDVGIPVAASEPAAKRGLQLSRAELIANSGLSDERLTELIGYGLVAPVPGTAYFDADTLAAASTLAEMAEYGLEPRHVRAFKSAADRQVGLIEQVATPYRAQRGSDAHLRADEVAQELARLAVQLHATLVRQGLQASR